MFMEEINAIKTFGAGDLPSVSECDFSLWDESGIIELLLEEAKRECIETKSLCVSTSSLESNGSEYRLPNPVDDGISVVEAQDTFRYVLKKLKELGLKIKDPVEKVEVAVQKNANNVYDEEINSQHDVENEIKVNDRSGGNHFCKDMLDETESSLKEETEDNESVDSGIHGMSPWDQDANTISESSGLLKQCLQNNQAANAAVVCRPCETVASPSNQLASQSQIHSAPLATTQQQESIPKMSKRYSMPCNSSDYGLCRNRLILHVVGSSRLRERLRSKELKSQSFLRPVHYHFWVPADEQTLRCFHNPADRRILSISRLSACTLRLQPVVRKDAHGMNVKQVLVDSPSLEALIRCCHMLDEKFPLFNASVGLHCSQNISIEAEEATDKTSFIGYLLDQLEEVSTRTE
ncbi:unnamed protein product [Schistocephalus solidus]|uniref:RanBD1 domain-containing protein n=1 Tax=Schistocephalus solidus TaxID=70667 RepID=A0A183THT3_SCHSO|nr:unnamed protein product [Schistocephalus solidus]